MSVNSSTMVKLHLKHHNLQRQFDCLKNKMYDIHKRNIFKNDDNIFTFYRTKMTILRSIFIFSVVEMSKNSPKKKQFWNCIQLPRRFNVCKLVNDGKVSLKAAQPATPILFPQKNKMYDIHKIKIFKNDDNIFTFDGTKMSILR